MVEERGWLNWWKTWLFGRKRDKTNLERALEFKVEELERHVSQLREDSEIKESQIRIHQKEIEHLTLFLERERKRHEADIAIQAAQVAHAIARQRPVEM